MSLIYEPEYEEEVEQDIVMELVDGKWIDVTEVDEDDPEGEQQQ